MKKQEKQKTAEALSILPGVIMIAVVLLALFAALFVFLWRSDRVVMVFGGIFSSSEEGAHPDGTAENIFLPASTSTAVSREVFYTPELSALPEDREGIAALLGTILPSERLEQTLSVSVGSGAAETVRVLRDGARYRVESASTLVICDGETVYLRQDTGGGTPLEHWFSPEESAFSLSAETGVPLLSEIIAAVERSEAIPNVDFNNVEKLLLLSGITEDGIVKTISLAYETGLVLYAATETEDGTPLYRCLSTAHTLNPEFSADAFTVPPM